MKNCLRLFIICIGLCSCANKQEEETNEDHEGHGSVSFHDTINESPGQTVVSSQRTVKPELERAGHMLKLNGYIVPDERRTNKITVRAGGRIEKLFVKFPYQRVSKGEKILELYSPGLNTYIEEYLYTLAEKDTSLSERAKQKLLLLGLTDRQLSEIEKNGQIPSVISIYAPQSGYVLPGDANKKNKTVMQENSGGNDPGMDGMNMITSGSDKYSGEDSWLREGMYVNKDQELFAVNDLKQVWGIAMGNGSELAGLKTGDTAWVKSEQIPERTIVSNVNFIEPFYEEGQKFIRLRLYLDNSDGALQLNSLFKAEIKTSKNQEALVLPVSAVLDLGQRKIAWVKTGNTEAGNGIFRLTEIKTGRTFDKKIVILDGLDKNTEVAEQAGYMLDSETIINKQ